MSTILDLLNVINELRNVGTQQAEEIRQLKAQVISLSAKKQED